MKIPEYELHDMQDNPWFCTTHNHPAELMYGDQWVCKECDEEICRLWDEFTKDKEGDEIDLDEWANLK